MPRVSASKPAAASPIQINVAPQPAEVETKEPEAKEERTPTWFFDLIAEIPAIEWGKVYDIWIYRIEPKVRMAEGQRGFLANLCEPITPAWIKQNYGGGKFRIVLNKNGRFKTSHDCDIEGAPIYDSRRERPEPHQAGAAGLGGNGDGAAFAKQVIDILRDELTRTRESNQGGSPVQDEALKMLTEASTRAMDVIKNQVTPAPDPTKQLESLVNAARNLGILGGTQPQQNPLLDKLVTVALERLAAPSNPLEQITMFLTVFEKLDALRGEARGGGGTRHWPEILAEKAVDHIPDVLNAIRENRETSREIADKRLAAAQTNARAVEAMRAVPSHPAAPQNPAAAGPSTAAAVPAVSPLQTVPLADRPQPAAASGFEQTDAFSDWLKRRMVALIREGAEAEALVDFLDGAKPGFANDLVAYPVDQVTAFLAADPILKDAVADPRWPALLAAARAYILEVEPESVPVPRAN